MKALLHSLPEGRKVLLQILQEEDKALLQGLPEGRKGFDTGVTREG